MGAPTPSTPAEELWRVGEAAAYLNGGAVDFGLDARAVRRLSDDPDCQIRAVSRSGHRWRWLVASTVRAERARRLAELDLVDPGWLAPPAG